MGDNNAFSSYYTIFPYLTSDDFSKNGNIYTLNHTINFSPLNNHETDILVCEINILSDRVILTFTTRSIRMLFGEIDNESNRNATMIFTNFGSTSITWPE